MSVNRTRSAIGPVAEWKKGTDEIPVPGIAPLAGPWVLERLVLEPLERETDGAPIFEQALAVVGDEVRHRSSVPNVPVQPEPAAHRVEHPVAAARELAVRR